MKTQCGPALTPQGPKANAGARSGSFIAACALILLGCFGSSVPAFAQTFTTLASFGGAFGYNPWPVVQGIDGNFYGVTESGPNLNDYGTIFKVTPQGALTTLYQFCSQPNCADGYEPDGALVQAVDGNFYGTTSTGGANNERGGTVYKVSPTGRLTTLYSFCAQPNCTDGNAPVTGLTQAADGNFYGTTEGGGVYGYGTAFRITPQGTLTTLHSFDGPVDGDEPTARLLQGSDGDLYGTTIFGYGDTGLGAGTIFRISPEGAFTLLYAWSCNENKCLDGSNPNGGLVQAPSGGIYGATGDGGIDNYGVIFKMTPEGTLTPLFSFDSTDGRDPNGWGPLLVATDANLYGTTAEGGAYGFGNVFELTSSGKLSTLYSFCSQPSCTDGAFAVYGIIQATNGNFYGTTYGGGASGYGTFFGLTSGLAPFVETLLTSGRVGAGVVILGNNLLGASNVSFNGTSAAYTIVSNTAIRTTVPVGATTGFVTVVTPSGALTSNKIFRVIQEF
jgi:uncharacterized repeat protein (TIGR03803 family)